MEIFRIRGPAAIAFVALAAGALFAIYMTASSIHRLGSLEHRPSARHFPALLYAGYPEEIREMVRMADVETDSCMWGHSDDPEALRACDRAGAANFAIMKRGWCPQLRHNYSPAVWTKCDARELAPPGFAYTPQFTEDRIATIVAQRKADGSHARFVKPIVLSEIRSAPRREAAPAMPPRALEILKAQGFSQPLDRNPTLRRLGRVRDAGHYFDFYALRQDGDYGHLIEALVVLLDAEKYIGHYPLTPTDTCTMQDDAIACGPKYEFGRAILNYRHGRLPAQMLAGEDIDLSR